MQIEQQPLRERIDLLNAGYCAHREFIAASIYRFANLPMTTYFLGLEPELTKLEGLIGLSHKDTQSMTYRQIARRIDERLYLTPSCGDAYLYAAIELMAAPLMKAPGERAEPIEQMRDPTNAAGRRRSLDERIGNNDNALEDCIMCAMDVEGLLPFMGKIISPHDTHFADVYDDCFRQYGDKTFEVLIRESANMPKEERRNVQYHLLIEPFARLPECPQ